MKHCLLCGAVFRIRIHFIRIRIQNFRLNTDPDPDSDPIRIQGFDDQKLKEIYSWKKTRIFDIKSQFTCTKASIKDVQAKQEAFIPQSLKRKHPALQNMTCLHLFLLFGSFFSLGSRPVSTPCDWIRIRFGSGSGFETLVWCVHGDGGGGRGGPISLFSLFFYFYFLAFWQRSEGPNIPVFFK